MLPNSAGLIPVPAVGAELPAAAGQVAMHAPEQLLVPPLSLVNAYRVRPSWSVRIVPRLLWLALIASARGAAAAPAPYSPALLADAARSALGGCEPAPLLQA